MEFAKYYNVTEKVNELIDKDKLFCYHKDSYKGIYICSDTHDFWISRILEGYNSEYEEEPGKWLVERNKMDKYDLITFIENENSIDYHVDSRGKRDTILAAMGTLKIIENLILMDDDAGLEQWDDLECDSYDEAIEAIDGGFGILTLTA